MKNAPFQASLVRCDFCQGERNTAAGMVLIILFRREPASKAYLEGLHSLLIPSGSDLSCDKKYILAVHIEKLYSIRNVGNASQATSHRVILCLYIFGNRGDGYICSAMSIPSPKETREQKGINHVCTWQHHREQEKDESNFHIQYNRYGLERTHPHHNGNL
jgi:hypothetical protein